MSTLSTANIQTKAANTPPVIKDVNGNEVGHFARCWVSFNGNSTPLQISNSLGIASVTDVATGQYDITFTTAFPDTGYAVIHGGLFNSGNGYFHSYYDLDAASVRLLFISTANAYVDSAHVSAAFFGRT